MSEQDINKLMEYFTSAKKYLDSADVQLRRTLDCYLEAKATREKAATSVDQSRINLQNRMKELGEL